MFRIIDLRYYLFVALMILSLGIPQVNSQTKGTPKSRQQDKPISAKQRQAIEKIVREYLIKNPDVVRDAMAAQQINESQQRLERIALNLKAHKSELYSDPKSPVAGNPNGDITIVVFSDYYCGYCRKSVPGLESLLQTDKSLRIVYKEFPILGPQSQMGALAALAASRQGKYLSFHRELFATEKIDNEVIKSISDRLGLNYPELQRAMADNTLNEAIGANQRLASVLDIDGTPAYIIGEQVIPGAIDLESVKRIIAIERKKLAN